MTETLSTRLSTYLRSSWFTTSPFPPVAHWHWHWHRGWQTLASYIWFFNASGLAGVAKEVHISFNAEGAMPAGTLATISRLIHAFIPTAVVSVYDTNEYEFRAILQAWKFGVQQTATGHPDDIVLYCHNKGATHGSTSVPILAATAGNWKYVRRLFATGTAKLSCCAHFGCTSSH